MAKCKRCKMEMCDSSTKTCETYNVVEFPDGTKMSPAPYNPSDPNIRCHDCGVTAGGVHHIGCDMEICPRCGSQFLECSCLVPEIESAVEKILKLGMKFLKVDGVPSSLAFFITPKEKFVIDPFDFRNKKMAKKRLKKIAKKRRATMVITLAHCLMSKFEGTASDPPYFRRDALFAYGETKHSDFGISQEFECKKNNQIKLGKKTIWQNGESEGPMTGFLHTKISSE